METCKHCLHYEVCQMHYKQKCELTYETEREVRIAMRKAQIAVDIECDHYKDCSQFIKLPCKVGDIVYKICPVEKGKGCSNCPWEYCECHDIGFQNDRKNSIREGKANDIVWILKRMPYFGKIYFTNREEAKQALKERKKDE